MSEVSCSSSGQMFHPELPDVPELLGSRSISSFAFGTCSFLVLLLLRVQHGVSGGGRVPELLILQDRDLEFTINILP
jgi:hypothetical protein